MRVKPPCKVDGMDCPRRYVGCRATCDEWAEWMVRHAEEVEQAIKKRREEKDVTEFLVQQGERTRRCNQARVGREGRKK